MATVMDTVMDTPPRVDPAPAAAWFMWAHVVVTIQSRAMAQKLTSETTHTQPLREREVGDEGIINLSDAARWSFFNVAGLNSCFRFRSIQSFQ